MITVPIVAAFDGLVDLFGRHLAVLLGFCGLIASACGSAGIVAAFRSGNHNTSAAALIEERDAKLSSIVTTAVGMCLLGAATLVLYRIGI